MVLNSLHKQLNYDISSGGAYDTTYITYNNFVAIAIKRFLETVDRRSIISTIHKKKIIVDGSLLAKFIGAWHKIQILR